MAWHGMACLHAMVDDECDDGDDDGNDDDASRDVT